MGRLRRVDCSGPGIRRRRRGRGFEYLDENGRRVTTPEVLDRIRELAIPPAWESVWICSDALGHLQATGIDAAKRKQYLYHQRWRERRDQKKFDEMLDFARSLPRMRRIVTRDLRKGDLSKEQVLASSVRLLDWGSFRIGSEDYAEQNESYGLATMLKRHVTVNGQGVKFEYRGKSGQHQVHLVLDPEVRDIVAALKKRRAGPELLAYRNGRKWMDVDSADINEYLKAATGGDFSAKDFRTWNATMLAAHFVAHAAESSTSATSRKRVISLAVKRVALLLGNTPAVCRASYIDPRVFDRYQSGWTIGGAVAKLDDPIDISPPWTRAPVERAVIDLIEGERTPALEKVA